jgi:hypothetical protein
MSGELLVRIDERTQNIEQEISEIKATMAGLEAKFVTYAEFAPVKKVVYGLVGAVLIAVLGAVVGLVVTKG